MSFLRHGEIYRPMQKRERPAHDRPQPHRYDEFPAGYSLAGCAPAEPASPSPAITHSAGNALGSTIKMQRTANHLLTACLTQGDNPRGMFPIEKNGIRASCSTTCPTFLRSRSLRGVHSGKLRRPF